MVSNLKKLNKTILLILLVASFLALTSCTQPADDQFTFVFMTDIHLQEERAGAKGFEKAIGRTNQIDPDFVLTGGDQIMDALGQSQERATHLFDLYDRLTKKFNMCVYNTLGNHDVFGLYEESGISPQHPKYGKTMYKERMQKGLTYYSFDHKGWHFMILDGIGYTEDRHYYGRIDSAQQEWIRQDLASIDKNTPIIVSVHIPFYSILAQAVDGGTEPLSEAAIITNNIETLDLFDGYNLKLVLQGHLHIVEDIFYKGTHFVTGGAVSGNWWNGSRYGFEEGFVVVEVDGDEFKWHYEDYGWKVKDGE